MKLLRIAVTARGPLAFPTRKPGAQFRESLPYVPGAAVYGALGGMLQGHPRFGELMHAIRCHNAYPAWPSDPWVRPLPLTAARAKGAEGASQDTLIDRVCWEQIQPAAMLYSPTAPDGRAWEAAGGFYAPARLSAGDQHIERSVTQRVLTRVAINRERGTAEDRLLYSVLAINEVSTGRVSQAADQVLAVDAFPTQFIGSVGVPDWIDLADQLKSIAYLGGRITSGLGSVEVAVEPPGAIESGDTLRRRIQATTDRVSRRATLLNRLMPSRDWQPRGMVFTVNLLSDAVLYEHGWRPTTTLTAEMLREATGLDAEIDLLRSFAASGIAGGYHVTWPGPKPTEVSTLMGSVFVFIAPNGLSETDIGRLADLQMDGIGMRRAEGYGQVRICDEFHLEHALDYGAFSSSRSVA